MLSGLKQVDAGMVDLEQASVDRDEAYREADLQETLNRIRLMHTMIDELMQALEEASDSKTKTSELANDVVEADARSIAATLVPA